MEYEIPLEREQEQLFEELVEASRSVERSERNTFMYVSLGQHDQIQGNGLLKVVLGEDVLTLQKVGLIEASNYHSKGSGFNFFIPPDAYKYYEQIKKRSGEPIREVEDEVRRYLDADSFRAAYPAAYNRWAEAADLLWKAESDHDYSTIGHKCREAIQEFATALVEKYQPPEVNPDKAMTRERLSAVVELRRGDSQATRSELLNALFDYWRAAGNLVQRQEHAGQREAEPLVWEDGRRVVFQTAILMFEIDRAL